MPPRPPEPGGPPEPGRWPAPLDPSAPGVSEDLVALQGVAYAVEAELIGHDGIPPLTETVEELRAAGLSWLGVRVDGRLVGAVAWSVTEDGAVDVERLVVHPEHARRGHARRLLADLPPAAVTLVSTGRDNTPARALYESEGFTPVEDVEVVPGLWITRQRRVRP